MILGYILALSLLIVSVIRVTDAFFFADKKIGIERTKFIEETRKKHKNGNITVIAALFTMMVSALLMYFVFKMKVELRESRYRKDSYLCFHYQNIQTQNYISDMVKLNWALRTAFAATLSVVATAEAKAAWEGLKLAQKTRHLYYIKTIASSPYCREKVSNLPYLNNMPFETTKAYMLTTNIDGTTKLRENKWTIKYYKNPQGIRLSKSFLLEATMSADNAFLPNFKIETKELGMPVFPSLR